jgi:hypothetical protein
MLLLIAFLFRFLVFGIGSLRSARLMRIAGIATLVFVWATTNAIHAQSGGLVGAPSRLDSGSQVRTVEYNAEWVESSSPVAGGVVSTTHFPNTGNTITTVREGAGPMGASSSVLTSAPLAQNYAPQSYSPQATSAPTYAAIPTGNGGYMVPTVQYVPMNSGVAGASYQVASAPYGTCASCQTQMMTQPTAFQPGLVQQPYASQPPVLSPSGGVFGPISQQPAATYPGFYPVPQTQPQSGQGGYRALIPRSLPAGTYIGQGWAGQPKAYVSNQPFRNIMRYMILP